MSVWPLNTVLVRLLWLRALCGVAEGATVASTTAHASGSCVAAVLGDAQQRLCSLGGRDGMPRSLGSVLGCFVARFLGGFCGKHSRSIPTNVFSWANGIAISRDGAMLLVSDSRHDGSHSVLIFCVTSGVHLRTIGGWGNGPLHFNRPCQVYISTDDFVFVAEKNNNRIQVLTPRFEFDNFVGVGLLAEPCGVCANDACIAISEAFKHRISVFSRRDRTLLRRFGSYGSGVGQLEQPLGLCFTGGNIAVASHLTNCISVFRLDGEFVRSMGAKELWLPTGVACSETGELIVASYNNMRVVVFDARGEVLHSYADGAFTAVAVHCGTIIASEGFFGECKVYT